MRPFGQGGAGGTDAERDRAGGRSQREPRRGHAAPGGGERGEGLAPFP